VDLWFASQSDVGEAIAGVLHTEARLLENEPSVLRSSPAIRSPRAAHAVRTVQWRYWFTTREERRQHGRVVARARRRVRAALGAALARILCSGRLQPAEDTGATAGARRPAEAGRYTERAATSSQHADFRHGIRPPHRLDAHRRTVTASDLVCRCGIRLCIEGRMARTSSLRT